MDNGINQPCASCENELKPIGHEPCNTCYSGGHWTNFEPKLTASKTELEQTKIALDLACKRICELTDQIVMLTVRDDDSRKPVGICSGSQYSAKTVVCDDGTCFVVEDGKWVEGQPIPGTRADLRSKGKAKIDGCKT
jgi:hypothetical protein